MAQWNPNYGYPNQNSFFDDPSITHNYGSTTQELNYNYYFPNNYVHYNSPAGQRVQQQFFAQPQYRFGENKNIEETASRSNLTPTAAEFHPSAQVNTQTFYRNDYKPEDTSRGAVRKFDRKVNEPRSFNQRSDQRLNQRPDQRFDQRPDQRSDQRPDQRSDQRPDQRSDQRPDQRSDQRTDQRFDQRPDQRLDSRRFNRGERFQSGRSFRNDSDSFYRDYKPERNNWRDSNDDEFSGSKFDKYGRNPERNGSERNAFFRDQNSKSNGKNAYRNKSRYSNNYENWRSNISSSDGQEKRTEMPNSKNELPKQKSFEKERKQYKDFKHSEKASSQDDDISQKDRLTEQVNKGTLECLVCCDRVRQSDKIWHCLQCYHIFHLRCIIKWGNSSKDDKGWRCPACQHVSTSIPSEYYCYCGQMYDPPYMPGDTAHSCGNMCGRLGLKPGCVHRCNLRCHPGPCPKCESLISRKCNCGATTQMVKCNAETTLICTAICSKILKCGVHTCDKKCHAGDCDSCQEIIEQECYCLKSIRKIPCSKEQLNVQRYSCEQVCGKALLCGNHNCGKICHDGPCDPCATAADFVKSCPCGQTKLEVVRATCLDPIPCCDKICGRKYPLCGTATAPHLCKSQCHAGDCPPCSLTSFVRCRCGHMSCEIACSELVSRTDDARCEKKCVKKRSCGKHKCNQLCCIDIDHICPLPCNHMLSCGQHRCEQTCHKGRCQPCWRISFDELFCECGASVIYPPIQCGTKRPHCTRPCTRDHDCEHEAIHTCHSQPECPPCTVLTTKYCYGGHEKRTTIPCHQKEFSCGLPCGKELPCKRHKCILPCHGGLCLKDGQNCTQPCVVVRETCGHACGLPCHDPPCPESPCKEMVKVTCQCGLRSSSRICIDMTGEYQRIATSMLASKMADMQLGHSVDIADIVGTTARKQTLRTLECNDECRQIERNRRLAIGLQIRNPDLSAKLTPRYSDFMKQWAKKDGKFCQMIHDKLTELVQLAKQSKQKSRSYSFPSMNRDKRQFVHECCEHFGCESAAYDQEPNRNVVATAVRDKAWLPSCSLLELLQRENGQRKVPGPILNRPLGASKTVDSVTLKISTPLKPATPTSSSGPIRPKSPESEDIDYFNFPSVNKFNCNC